MRTAFSINIESYEPANLNIPLERYYAEIWLNKRVSKLW